MGKWSKFRARLLDGRFDKGIRFSELVAYLEYLGFSTRTRGSHQIFYRTGIEEQVNLQKSSEGNAKSYQVKQVRELIVRYRIGADEDEV